MLTSCVLTSPRQGVTSFSVIANVIVIELTYVSKLAVLKYVKNIAWIGEYILEKYL